MVTIDTIVPEPSPCRVATSVGACVPSRTLSLRARLKLWWRRRRTRVHLSQLTEDQLRDVGLSPEMAEREIRKSRLLLVERAYQPPF
ncbi:MAG: DUF1127 domain-containing protein [Allorhizobium sp.]|jgi:uncharacterized protein YjiS (DUF1127 family)